MQQTSILPLKRLSALILKTFKYIAEMMKLEQPQAQLLKPW